MTTPFLAAFHEAYDAHHGSLFRFLDRLSGDPDLAADLAQEAFVRLHRRGSMPERPGAWLVTVALNLLRTERTTAVRRRDLARANPDDVGPASGPTPLEAAVAEDRSARVRRALAGLAERERRLLLLRAEGYAYADLARILELNEASVGTLLARAKARFREAYDGA